MTQNAGLHAPARLGDLVAHERGLRLRPHARTHKSAAIANLQMAAGAVGVCVQKLSEAEALAAHGVPDSYIGVRGGLAHGVVESIWAVDARGCLT